MTFDSSVEFFGFTGKILSVDLSKETIKEEQLNAEYANNYLGGAGYACRYLYDFLDKVTDPLSSENILMIMIH